jgi:galactokinase
MTEAFTERANGRVNLIGEHTDYNGGWVLPTSIPQFTQVTITRRDDNKVHLFSHSSAKEGAVRDFSYNLGEEKHSGEWTDYLQGATQLMMEFVKQKGQSFQGFEAKIESTMPEGSGLSSSAALEISFLKALRSAYKLDVSDVELARLGQRIENEFVGARVGIMDQMACSLAKSGVALFLDTLNLTYEQIPIPLDQMDLMVINSGISHKLSAHDGGYNERRSQCERACEILGIKQLRDITPTELAKTDLPEILMKRARHVVTENARVHEAVKAIKAKDLESLGKLFYESHKSMRDDYSVSIPEIDTMVELCMKDKDIYGARLTGGGFGGSIVAIAKKGSGKRIAEAVVAEYKRATGHTATHLA